jgi:hypothetical protein
MKKTDNRIGIVNILGIVLLILGVWVIGSEPDKIARCLLYISGAILLSGWKISGIIRTSILDLRFDLVDSIRKNNIDKVDHLKRILLDEYNTTIIKDKNIIKQMVSNYYNDHKGQRIYPSDVAKTLNLDPKTVFEISEELTKSRNIK